MMNKTKSILAAMAALANPVFAGTPAVTTVTPTPPVSELTAKAFASVVLDNSDEVVGGGLALESKLVGDLYGEVFATVLEDEVYGVGANALYYLPVTETVSLYGLAGGAYEFESDQWVVRTGGGVKVTLTQTVSLFADAAYNFTFEDEDNDGAVSIRAGVGFKF